MMLLNDMHDARFCFRFEHNTGVGLRALHHGFYRTLQLVQLFDKSPTMSANSEMKA